MRAVGFRRVFRLRGLPQPYDAACAPAQASPEQIVLRAEVIHPPLAFAGDPLLCLFRIGLIVGYNELDVPAQFLPRDRPRDYGQRMRWRTDGHHLHLT